MQYNMETYEALLRLGFVEGSICLLVIRHHWQHTKDLLHQPLFDIFVEQRVRSKTSKLSHKFVTISAIMER